MIVLAVQVPQFASVPKKLVRLIVLLHVESPVVDQVPVVNTVAKVLRTVLVVCNRLGQEKFATAAKDHIYERVVVNQLTRNVDTAFVFLFLRKL
jgi:hypothetical protein